LVVGLTILAVVEAVYARVNFVELTLSAVVVWRAKSENFGNNS
jgi:hypothetical protein